MMRSLGFDQVIDYTREDFTKSGRRYDLILDTKTNRSVFKYPRVLSPGGTYVTVGGRTGRLLQAVFLGPMIRRITNKNIRVLGLKPNKDLDYLNELFEAGKVKPVIDGPYRLNDIPEVIQYFGAGSHKGKLVVSLESTGNSEPLPT